MAKVITYDPTWNRLYAKGGTEIDSITFADLYQADRAGTLKLLDGTIDANPDTFSLDRQVRPVELRALQLDISCTPRAGTTCDISGKDAWGNNISENGIDISSGSATTQNRFSEVDANGVTVHGLQNGDDFDINQNQWGVIWDLAENTYHLDVELYLGDGTTSSYFKDVNKLIVFTQRLADYCGYPSYGYARPIYLYSNAHIKLGELINEGTKETYKGCVIQSFMNVDTIYLFDGYYSNTYRYLYGCTVVGSESITNTLLVMGKDDMRIWNCNFVNHAYPSVGGSTDLYRCTVMGSIYGFEYYYGEAPTVEDYVVHDGVVAAVIAGQYFDCTIRRLKATSEKAVSIAYNHTKDITLLDCDLENWVMYTRGETQPGKILRKYTVHLNVADENGANLPGANVVCKDKNNNVVFDVETDEEGNIPVQEVTYQEWYQLSAGWHGEEDAICYSPHSFEISHDEKESLIYENITLDKPINWHLELQKPFEYQPQEIPGLEKVYVGDKGTVFEIDVGLDLSSFTVLQMKVKKGNGTEVVWDATVKPGGGTNNFIMRYKTSLVTSDFDCDGIYYITPYAESPSWKGHGKTVSFKVYPLYE